MIGQVLRFWPEYQYLRSFVDDPAYGPVTSAKFERSCGLPDWSGWLPVEARSGGATLDLLVHDIDQALYLFEVPEFVEAKQAGEQDAVQAKLTYRTGPAVEINGGWLAPGAPLSMTFRVAKKKAVLEMSGQGLQLIRQSGEPETVEVPEGDGYAAEIAYFVECVQQGRKPERCVPEESGQAVKMALAIKESRQRNGERVGCGD